MITKLGICAEEFPNCCGSCILSNFPEVSPKFYGHRVAGSSKSTMRKAILEIIDELKSDGLDGDEKSTVVAYTADYQVDTESVLKELGWDELLSTKNPNSQNVITLWVYKL